MRVNFQRSMIKMEAATGQPDVRCDLFWLESQSDVAGLWLAGAGELDLLFGEPVIHNLMLPERPVQMRKLPHLRTFFIVANGLDKHLRKIA